MLKKLIQSHCKNVRKCGKCTKTLEMTHDPLRQREVLSMFWYISFCLPFEVTPIHPRPYTCTYYIHIKYVSEAHALWYVHTHTLLGLQ